jgi:redox-sensitive bicupin YhaK (pirin superfamily)
MRRHSERRRVQRGAQDIWHTFYQQQRPGQSVGDFGVLAALDEMRLPPGSASARQVPDESEIVTYLRRAVLAQEDSTGDSGVLQAGEFQHMTVGRRIRRKETNASGTEWAHIFRISFRPSQVGLGSAHEQKRFPSAQRHNRLCVVASPDEREGSLRTRQDVVVCSSVLDPGHHLIHELARGRSAWLHLICGEATFHDLTLFTGDGVGVTKETSVSLTAHEFTEILLVDLGTLPTAAAGVTGP